MDHCPVREGSGFVPDQRCRQTPTKNRSTSTGAAFETFVPREVRQMAVCDLLTGLRRAQPGPSFVRTANFPGGRKLVVDGKNREIGE